jgi:inner membrane protein YidH
MANPRIVETNKKLKDSAVRIKDSAAQMERSTARVEDSADRRTELAADRTIFAAERTYSAWVRTGLVAMASGIGAKALMSDVLPEWLVITTASVLMLFSVFCFSAAVWRHLYPGPQPPSTRCCAHSSGAADFDKCVFVGRFDSGANRHLVGTDARLNRSIICRPFASALPYRQCTVSTVTIASAAMTPRGERSTIAK